MCVFWSPPNCSSSWHKPALSTLFHTDLLKAQVWWWSLKDKVPKSTVHHKILFIRFPCLSWLLSPPTTHYFFSNIKLFIILWSLTSVFFYLSICLFSILESHLSFRVPRSQSLPSLCYLCTLRIYFLLCLSQYIKLFIDKSLLYCKLPHIAM